MDKPIDQVKNEKTEIDLFLRRQNSCKHETEFLPVGQQTFPDMVKQKLVLINTIMCKTCGKQFVQTLEPGITVSRVTPQPNFRV